MPQLYYLTIYILENYMLTYILYHFFLMVLLVCPQANC